MSDRRYLRPFYTDVWVAVVSLNKKHSAYELRQLSVLKEIAREHHGQIRDAIDALVNGRYLVSHAGSPTTYGYAPSCQVPRGCSAPANHGGTGFEIAGPRVYCSETMPRTYSYAAPAPQPDTRPPSRIGNKLHWRDGRVTDLDGN